MPSPSPDASTLVTPTDYQRVTGDAGGADQSQPALNDALQLIQDYLGRQLVYGQYTETLKVYRNNTIYPSATPITSVISPSLALVSIQGAGLYIGYYNPAPVVDYGDWNAAIPPQSTIVYTGGFGPGAEGTVFPSGFTATPLPHKLYRALCMTAFNVLHPAALAGIPGGVNSVHVGDIGYSGTGPLRNFEALDDAVIRLIKGFRHPHVMGWQTG